MKRSIITFLAMLLALCQTAMSQRTLNGIPQMKPANLENAIRIEGLSASSAFLLTDLIYGKLSESQLVEKYGLVYSNGQLIVPAFVEGGEEALAHYGAKVVSTNDKIVRANIPLNQFMALAQSGSCSWIDVGSKRHLALDEARAELGIDNIYNGIDLPQGYDGTGVVVGIIDVGFEYCHPSFYDSTGTIHRVKRVWDQNATGGPHPTGFYYGREMTTTAQMMAAQCSHIDQSHGSHVTGIAAGCGGNTDSTRRFRGMAPAADIVLVATTMEDAGIFDGITYICDYAASQNKPCVINMSIGGHIGPHDGTSSFDRSVDAVTSAHPEGFVLVGAAGNEGHQHIHISKQFSGSDSTLYTFIDMEETFCGVDLWGTPNVPFKVGLALVDTATGNFIETSGFYNSTDEMEVNDTLLDGQITLEVYCEMNPFNQRHNVFTVVNYDQYTNSPYYVCLMVQCNSEAAVHGWGTYASFVNHGFSMAQAGDVDYTVGEIGGTSHSIVTVGAYTTRPEWVDINGESHQVDDAYGDLTFFSSHGPTLDGRTKPDITAPGQYIFAPINSYDSSYVNGHCVASTPFNGGTHYYGVMRGTSMATPMVTGIIALWLQAHPNYGYDSVVTIVQSTGRTDDFTGVIPANGSNLWGWGKINPYGAFTPEHTGIETIETVDYTIAVGGRSIIIDAPDGEPVLIVDVLGRVLVAQKEVTHASYTMPAAGVYIVRVGNASARKVVVQ